MSYQSNAVLRRALLERLTTIGLCPDLRNDEVAVAQVCEQTGMSRDDVVRELAHLRVEHGGNVLDRMGLSARVPAFLASVSTTRNVLLARQLRQAQANQRFGHEYEARRQMTTKELIADLDMFEPVVSNRRERHDHERYEVEQP